MPRRAMHFDFLAVTKQNESKQVSRDGDIRIIADGEVLVDSGATQRNASTQLTSRSSLFIARSIELATRTFQQSDRSLDLLPSRELRIDGVSEG